MSDQEQSVSGADVNALRNNIPVGESRDLEVTSIHGTTVAARVTNEPDFDADNVTFVPEEYRPAVGETARFTHVKDESATSGYRLEVSPIAVEAPTGEESAVAEEAPASEAAPQEEAAA